MIKYVADYVYVESANTKLFTAVLLPEEEKKPVTMEEDDEITLPEEE